MAYGVIVLKISIALRSLMYLALFYSKSFIVFYFTFRSSSTWSPFLCGMGHGLVSFSHVKTSSSTECDNSVLFPLMCGATSVTDGHSPLFGVSSGFSVIPSLHWFVSCCPIDSLMVSSDLGLDGFDLLPEGLSFL